MNKLITSLACGTVLSMSLLGAGSISAAPGGMTTTIPGVMSTTAPGMHSTTTDGRMGNMHMRDLDDRTMDNRGNTLMNETRDSMHKTESIMKDKIRTGDNSSVSPLSNNNTTGRYRAQSTTTTGTTNNDNRSNWGWLGLLGLLGLAGMRSRTGERDRH